MGEGNASPILYKTSMEKYVHIELHGENHHSLISAFNVKIIEGLGTDVPDFVNSKGYVPKQGDMIYLLPGVNIPRVKLKDLALNLGIRVVRDPEKANVIFSGKSSMGKMTGSSWYYIADAELILSSCSANYHLRRAIKKGYRCDEIADTIKITSVDSIPYVLNDSIYFERVLVQKDTRRVENH